MWFRTAVLNFAHGLKTEAYILFFSKENATLLQDCWFEEQHRKAAAGHDDDNDDDELHKVTVTISKLLSVSFCSCHASLTKVDKFVAKLRQKSRGENPLPGVNVIKSS